ncbi:hypothetical protein [uncultured Paracoccus sp.]|uniref:hypothetical protein n=1 Tax=uncultured Paracoccus sp. TaxID=189685 RepID=UPI0030D8E540|tara:strand:- start:1166 stop:1552 length:387 start_codon:yes stop_codon:yes gene_type:complete
MRRPTTEPEAYRWWRDTLAGLRPARHEDDPQCGFYKTRVVRGGPWVGVAIWLEQDIDPETGELTAPETFAAICNGQNRRPEWIRRNWTYFRPISADDYDALIGFQSSISEMAATNARLDLAAMAPIAP